MRQRKHVACWIMAVATAAVGCLPQTTVRKAPGPADTGIRYYRPKPYLVLRPQVDDDGVPVEGYVALALEYLPDFSEEYAIHVRSGWGVNQTRLTLDQGWNLTAVNVDLDSQTDEKIAAVGELLQGAGEIVGPRGGAAQPFVVRAANVPLGYYEAVVGEAVAGPGVAGAGVGCKRLLGFQYVGFLPFACGGLSATSPSTGDGGGPLYALVTERGVMTFKPLGEVAAVGPREGLNQLQRRSAPEELPQP